MAGCDVLASWAIAATRSRLGSHDICVFVAGSGHLTPLQRCTRPSPLRALQVADGTINNQTLAYFMARTHAFLIKVRCLFSTMPTALSAMTSLSHIRWAYA